MSDTTQAPFQEFGSAAGGSGLAAYCEARGLTYEDGEGGAVTFGFTSRDADAGVEFRLTPVPAGLHVRARSSHEFPSSRWDELLRRCNDWNRLESPFVATLHVEGWESPAPGRLVLTGFVPLSAEASRDDLFALVDDVLRIGMGFWRGRLGSGD